MARIPLAGLEIRARQFTSSTLHTIADRLEERMRENASLTDHTLEELRKLHYPYSAHNPHNPHTPPYLVHHQGSKASGHKTGTDLSDAIHTNIINQYRIQIGVDESLAPHIRDIIYGTDRMFARDFISGSFFELKDEFPQLWEQALKEMVIFT